MSPTRVLLVEDNRADARLMAELLSEVPGRPFTVTAVETLAQALVHLPQHDVVLLDLSLPDAFGLSTVERTVQAGRTVPIVVLTGTDDEQVATDALKAGAQDYLLKAEITPSLVARSIRYAIERKRVETAELERTKSDRAAQQAQFLARVAADLTRTLALDQLLSGLAQRLVPALGDLVTVDLVREDGSAARAAAAATSAELETVARDHASAADEAAAVVAVVTEHGTLRVSNVRASEPALDGSLARFAARAGARSMLLTPLVARERVVGAISFIFAPSQRQHSDDDQMLAEEIAAHAALAIENLALFAQAQQAIRARDGLLAVVSHDLRNPLEVIALALSLLEAHADAKQATILGRAHRALDRIKQLIDDLLDVVRIDAGTLRVEPRPMDVSMLLEEAYELHKPLAADKRIALVAEFSPDLGQAAIDKHRMSQVLANLLGNALKFTPLGGTIRFGAASQGARVVVYVADSGPGIAPENLRRVFDRFWQKEHTPSGVGLGLAIAKGIVEAHGGTIEVESTPGAGATFRLWIDRVHVRPEKVA